MFKVASNKKPVNIGNSHGFIVYGAYFINGEIKMDKKYDVYIKEVGNDTDLRKCNSIIS